MENKRYRCKKCGGCGLMKVNTIICDICDGIKCMSCGESGYKQMPWVECDNCFGPGEIDEKEAESLRKLGRFEQYMNPVINNVNIEDTFVTKINKNNS